MHISSEIVRRQSFPYTDDVSFGTLPAFIAGCEKSLTWEFECLFTMLVYLRCRPPSQQNAINPALLISLGRGFRQVIDSSSGRLLELRTQKIMR